MKGDSGLGQAPIPRLARIARSNKVRIKKFDIYHLAFRSVVSSLPALFR